MRRYAKLLFVAATAVIAASAAALPDWPHAAEALAQLDYVSPEGDFSVGFPGPPEVAGRAPESDTAPGFWTYRAQDDHAAYQVRVDVYPKAIRVPAPNPRTYEFILRAHATESSGQLVSTAPVQIGDRVGMEGVFTYPSGLTEVLRVVMAGHRVYQVTYTQADAGAPVGQGGAFLGSFVFIPRP